MKIFRDLIVGDYIVCLSEDLNRNGFKTLDVYRIKCILYCNTERAISVNDDDLNTHVITESFFNKNFIYLVKSE